MADVQHISVEGPAAAAQAFDEAKLSTVISGYGAGLRSLGMVRGITVRSRNIVANIGAGFKAMAGGEIKTLTTLCEQARQEAMSRMLEQAAERGATGVLCIRYDTNTISEGITEVLAYGLAVTDSSLSSGSAPAAENEGIHSAYVCSSNELPGYTVHRSLGVVNGITVRSRNVAMAIGAGLKALAGGEIRNWTKMCDDARQEAYTRMVVEAVSRGADGVVAMRYSTNEIKEGITEVIAYGTAVTSTPSAPVDNATAATDGVPMQMVTTSDSIPDLNVCCSYGMVKGISVRSSNLMRSIGAGFKSIVGGEIRNWTDMCTETRALAFERMLLEARRMGAKGIIGMRYDATQVIDGITEVIAYGTAVSDQPQVHEVTTTELPQHMITTDLKIPGQSFSGSLGIVRGISVQSVNIFLGIGAAFKSIVGGEINNYTHMCERARQEAYGNMMKSAYAMGATGVTAMRFESNDLVPGVIEVVAYGTAVFDGSCGPANVLASAASQSSGSIDLFCLSTTNEVIGQNFERSLGVVRGITCRSKNFFANFGASMKAGFVGGEIHTWTALCEQSRIEATTRLIEEATSRGARGIVGLRYETNEIAAGITETIAFGTAVA